MWGCHGDGQVEHFSSSPEHRTRRCPRRHLLDHPDVVQIFSLRRQAAATADGLSVASRVTTAVMEAFDVIDDATAWRAEAAAKAAAKDNGGRR